MGLDQVVQEVRDGAEAHAQKILDAAKAEADAILSKARDEVKAYQKERAAIAERDADQLRRQHVSNAQFEARKLVLQTERELRTTLRDTIVAGLAALPAATRNKHLKALLARAEGIVAGGKVWGAKQDKETLSASSYTFAGEVDIAGGLIVESKDGTIRLNLSYETLLDDAWRDVLNAESGLFA